MLLGQGKLGFSGGVMLAGMAGIAVLVAFYVAPATANATALDETYVTYGIAAMSLVIAIAATMRANAMNKKNTAGKE
jgi:hypothetical protein